MVGGKRLRFVRTTKTDTERKATELRVARENEGRDSLTLPKELRIDAGKAGALLRPYKASLADAARYYVDHCLKFREAPPVKEIVARFMEERTSIVWADGTVEKGVPANAKKFANGEIYPEGTDYRMYWLTIAMNMMAKKGYEFVYMDGADIVMKRAMGK